LFVGTALPTRFLNTEMEDIKVGTDNMGNIICLSFHSASNRVAEELSSEEKAINKKKSKEKSERLLKSIMWEYNM
ncbi:5448_t:CDS:1, partial [Rhizophagus irregularis]